MLYSRLVPKSTEHYGIAFFIYLSRKGGFHMGKDLNGKELGTGISQKKDGRYVARFTNRFGIRQELKSRNLKEVKKLFSQAIYEDSQCLNRLDTNLTLDQWFVTWMDSYKKNTVCANTKRYYTEIYKKQISPALGKKKLADITQINVIQLINKLKDQGYEYESQNKVRILLQDMFERAIINDYLIKNPARGIRLGIKPKKEPRVLSPEEQATFFECSKGTFYDNLFVVAVSTGLRPGELCALTIEDINFADDLIHVDKTLVYQKFEGDEKKTFHVDAPKTKSSKRDVPINQQCRLALKKQMMQRNVIMGKRTAKPIEGLENILFTTQYGTPLNAVTFAAAIKSVVDSINMTRDELEKFECFSPHCFRHSFATRCFEAGIKPKTVQGYLGHATLQMTMDLYTHVLPEHSKEEMEKLEKVLDDTLDVSEETVNQKFDQFISKDSGKNIVYMERFAK